MRAAGPLGTPVWGRPAPCRAEAPGPSAALGRPWALAADLAFVPGASRPLPAAVARRAETSACSLPMAESVRGRQVALKRGPRLEPAVPPAPFPRRDVASRVLAVVAGPRAWGEASRVVQRIQIQSGFFYFK